MEHRGGRPDAGHRRGVGHGEPGTRVGHHADQLAGGGLRVDGHRDQAGAQRGEVGGHELDPVGQRDDHAVAARPGRARTSPARTPVDLGVELGPGDLPAGAGLDQRHGVGRLGSTRLRRRGRRRLTRSRRRVWHTRRTVRRGQSARRVSNGKRRPQRRDLRSRSVLAGEASAAAAEVESALRTEPDPTAAAFFDVDNTSCRARRSSTSRAGCTRRKFFTTRDIIGAAWRAGVVPARRRRGPGAHGRRQRASALAFIEGTRSRSWRRSARRSSTRPWHTGSGRAPGRSPQMHLDQGQRVWLVTAAPVEIARDHRPAARAHRRARHRRRDEDGVYTGRLVGELLHGPAKAEAVARAGRARGPGPGALLGVLATPPTTCRCCRLVGDPCAVNPDPKLREHARGAGLAGPRLPHRPQGGAVGPVICRAGGGGCGVVAARARRCRRLRYSVDPAGVGIRLPGATHAAARSATGQ